MTENTLHNVETKIADKDYSSPVIEVIYPSSWYISYNENSDVPDESDHSSNSLPSDENADIVVSPTDQNTVGFHFILWFIMSMAVLLVLPIIQQRT